MRCACATIMCIRLRSVKQNVSLSVCNSKNHSLNDDRVATVTWPCGRVLCSDLWTQQGLMKRGKVYFFCSTERLFTPNVCRQRSNIWSPRVRRPLSVRVAIISEPNAWISFKFGLLLPLSHTCGRFFNFWDFYFVFLALLEYVSRAHGNLAVACRPSSVRLCRNYLWT